MHRTALVRGVSRYSFDSQPAKRSYFDEELSTKSKEALRADTAAEPESGNETLRMNFRLEEIANEITSTANLDRKVKLAAQALAMVRSAKDPDSVSYNTLLKVLAKTSPLLIHKQPAAFLAKRILERMKQLHEHQRRANREWYDKVLVPPETTDVASIAVVHGPPIVRIKPNVRSYATVMDAFARMATRPAALQTEQLLKDLEQRWRDNDRDFALEPNEVIYNTILTAWAKAGDADECQNWLDRIEAPSTYNYNAVLTALAKSNKALQAESLLRNMKAPPNNRSYCACMDAWARLGIPDKAHALLLELIDLYHNSGRRKDLEPNAVAYSSLIQAYVRSDRVDKVAQAQQVLADMQTAGIKPNSWTYNMLLNCYASSALTGDDESPTEKLRRIKAIYREQLAAGNESTRTFGTVMKACEHLLLWDIDPDFCVSVFQDAVDRGLVSSWVLRQFYGAVPVEVFRRLVQIKDYKEWAQLPDEWTRRARQEE
jgi:pentatricopeptide repeat protein